jgi:hypothetical protein
MVSNAPAHTYIQKLTLPRSSSSLSSSLKHQMSLSQILDVETLGALFRQDLMSGVPCQLVENEDNYPSRRRTGPRLSRRRSLSIMKHPGRKTVELTQGAPQGLPYEVEPAGGVLWWQEYLGGWQAVPLLVEEVAKSWEAPYNIVGLIFKVLLVISLV